MIDRLNAVILASGGLPTGLQPNEASAFVNRQTSFRVPASYFKWSLLPSISIEITSNVQISLGVYQTFKLILGPRQYIQQDDTGFWQMVIRTRPDTFVSLGLPIFSAYYILLDRDAGTIGFSPGCGCNIASDGYPKIQRGSSLYQSSLNGPGWEVKYGSVYSASFKAGFSWLGGILIVLLAI
jgi:hypothetical protein